MAKLVGVEEKRALAELVESVDVKIVSKKDLSKPYVGLEHLPSRGSQLNGWVTADSSISVNSVFSRNDVLFGKLRPNLRKCVVAPFDGYCSTDILVLRPKSGVDAGFVGKVFQTELVGLAAEESAVGTKMPRTSWKHLGQVKVFCPEVGAQKRITEIIDALDFSINDTEKLIAKLNAIKQGLLQDLLTRGIDNNGELRPVPKEKPTLYKKTALGLVSVDWEEISLGDVIRRSGGILQTGPFGSQLHAHEYVDDGIPVIMPQDIVDGGVSLESIARILPRKATALARHRVRANDIIFSRRGDLSRCAAIETHQEGWLCGTGCLLARMPEKEINGYWLSVVYPQHAVNSQVMGLAVGSTMANLNTSILSNIRVARPGIEEQNEIARRLKDASYRITSEEKSLEKMKIMKKGLMDDLLTGRKRVTALLNQLPQL